MDFLRKIVSGPKKRFKEDGYNLDLTYICPRLIAMSFPASGIETLYRNNIDKVSSMIKKKHGSDYIIINLSGRKYDYSKFQDQVYEFQWEDHHSPPIDTLFHICQQIHAFLEAKIENVAIIHCLAGKGRTGTIICCYMMYSGRFKTPQEALMYYGKKRFLKEGLGVNQPCQIRYVYYFHQILTERNLYPTLKYIKSVEITGRPKISDDGCRPFIELVSVHSKQKLFTTVKSHSEQSKFTEGDKFKIVFDNPKPISGDILLRMINNGAISNKHMFRISFNTAFIKPDNVLEFTKPELSPSQILKDTKIPRDFVIKINFGDSCKCDCFTPFDKKCTACEIELEKEFIAWKSIYSILQKYQPLSEIKSNSLLFGNEIDDVDEVLRQQRKTIVQAQVALCQNVDDDWEKISNQCILEFFQSNEGNQNNNNKSNSSSDDDDDEINKQKGQKEQDNEQQLQQEQQEQDMSEHRQLIDQGSMRIRSGTESAYQSEEHKDLFNQASRKRSMVNPNIYDGILKSQELYDQEKLQIKLGKGRQMIIGSNGKNIETQNNKMSNGNQYLKSRSQCLDGIKSDEEKQEKEEIKGNEMDIEDNQKNEVIRRRCNNMGESQKDQSPGYLSNSSDSPEIITESLQDKEEEKSKWV